MNRWKIPKTLENKIKNRDNSCVYCGSKFNRESYTQKATLEHIDNNAKNISETNIVLCCASCNASKGTKRLSEWLNSPYCQKKKINKETIANIVQEFLRSSD